MTGTVYYNSYGTNLAHNYCCTKNGAQLRRRDARHQARRDRPGPRRRQRQRMPRVPLGQRERVDARHEQRRVGQLPGLEPLRPHRRLRRDAAVARATGGSTGRRSTPTARSFSPTTRRCRAAASPARRSSSASATGGTVASTGLPGGAAGRLAGLLARRHARRVQLLRRRGPDGGAADGKSLAMMDFDPTTTRSRTSRSSTRPPSGYTVWPSFLPTNDGVIFELETVSNGRDWGETREVLRQRDVLEPRDAGEALVGRPRDARTPRRSRRLNGGSVPAVDGRRRRARRRHGPQLRADGEPRGRAADTPGSSSRAAASTATSRRFRPTRATRATTILSATPTTKKLWVAAIDLNAHAGHRPQPPGVLPAGAGAPRRQLARLLGRRPVRGERRVVPDRRPVLRRLLRATSTEASSAATSRRRARPNSTSAPRRATAAAPRRE